MTPDPQKVRVWDARAAAYDRLTRHWDIFSRLSNRLVDLLPLDLTGPVLDIGAGSGLTSQILLDRHPRSQAILIDPSEAMLEVARRNLAGRDARFLAMGLDGASVHDVHAVAAIASASMQFVDLAPAFATLARILAPGGHVAFNLWWHHWEETVACHCMMDWQPVAEAACAQLGLAPPRLPPRPVPKVRTRAELTEAASLHGFRLVAEHCDEFPTPVGFGLDFDAMDVDWPVKGLSGEVRQALLARMLELSPIKVETLVATRFLLYKVGA